MDEEEKVITKEIARRIKVILDKNKMSITALAYQAGMPRSTIHSLFNGKCQNIGVNTLWLICAYGFECKISDLLGDDWESIPPPEKSTYISSLGQAIKNQNYRRSDNAK